MLLINRLLCSYLCLSLTVTGTKARLGNSIFYGCKTNINITPACLFTLYISISPGGFSSDQRLRCVNITLTLWNISSLTHRSVETRSSQKVCVFSVERTEGYPQIASQGNISICCVVITKRHKPQCET